MIHDGAFCDDFDASVVCLRPPALHSPSQACSHTHHSLGHTIHEYSRNERQERVLITNTFGSGTTSSRQREVLIIDDHPFTADITASVVRNWSPLSRTFVAATVSEAMRCADREWFRVIVNLQVRGMQGLSLVRALAALGLAKRTCIVTAREECKTVVEAKRLRVLGYLQTSMPIHEFIDALRQIMDGTPVIPEIVRRGPVLRLSARQLGVLKLLHRGLSSKQIAHELNIAEGTAKNHTQMLLRTLSATNRAHAVARAIELGLLNGRETR